jgi:hypothetical protein
VHKSTKVLSSLSSRGRFTQSSPSLSVGATSKAFGSIFWSKVSRRTSAPGATASPSAGKLATSFGAGVGGITVIPSTSVGGRGGSFGGPWPAGAAASRATIASSMAETWPASATTTRRPVDPAATPR